MKYKREQAPRKMFYGMNGQIEDRRTGNKNFFPLDGIEYPLQLLSAVVCVLKFINKYIFVRLDIKFDKCLNIRIEQLAV